MSERKADELTLLRLLADAVADGTYEHSPDEWRQYAELTRIFRAAKALVATEAAR